MTFPCIKCKIHKYTITQIRKYTNTKCLKDPTCAIFLKSMGFKDIKYDIPMYQMENTYIHKYTDTMCLKDPTCTIFFKSMGSKADIIFVKTFTLADFGHAIFYTKARNSLES